MSTRAPTDAALIGRSTPAPGGDRPRAVATNDGAQHCLLRKGDGGGLKNRV
ncbi:hypothetical protein BHM03_00062797, partial [Ensete ventricosum]